MTFGEDFISIEGNQDIQAKPAYPTLFGLTLTPTIIGVFIALLGCVGAIYLVLNLVMPTWDKYQQLITTRNQKQTQVSQKEAVLSQAEAVKAELVQAQQQKQILALFANEQTLDTLLLDLNRLVESSNAQLQSNGSRATLTKFVPQNQSATELVTDGSLGADVNGKLKRQVVNIEMKGNFEQTESILRNIERLQSLLIVKDYTSQLAQDNSQSRISFTPEIISTSFQLQALIPATPEEVAQAAAANTNQKK